VPGAGEGHGSNVPGVPDLQAICRARKWHPRAMPGRPLWLKAAQTSGPAPHCLDHIGPGINWLCPWRSWLRKLRRDSLRPMICRSAARIAVPLRRHPWRRGVRVPATAACAAEPASCAGRRGSPASPCRRQIPTQDAGGEWIFPLRISSAMARSRTCRSNMPPKVCLRAASRSTVWVFIFSLHHGGKAGWNYRVPPRRMGRELSAGVSRRSGTLELLHA
jgi:hypothetical protein